MLPFAPGDLVQVRKLDYGTGHVALSWPATFVRGTDDVLVVRAPFVLVTRREVVVDGVPFHTGDIFTEYYYPGRWYNVFHVATPEGLHKGWYCNVTRPLEIDDEGISYVDLALDLFAHPNGRYTVLDEDEFEEAAQTLFAPEDVQHAQEALAELIRQAADGQLPSPVDAE
jgi:protein associated with RNAse G/E